MKIANYFTALRILLMVPLFLALRDTPSWWALGLYLGAGLTDILDGFLARKLNQASPFGAFFDKLADRFLTITVGVGLIAFGGLPPAAVVACLILIARDALVASLNEALPGQLDITVSWAEKVKITLNWLGFGFLMAPNAFGYAQVVGQGCLYLSAAACLLILGDYLTRAVRAFKAT